ncbi:hypothetical protein AX17_000641 [Amanita inopinata Kibby_2008]|nr:hypothetical protein AX17_000641 [Amanita inopinata Kibby_2008]
MAIDISDGNITPYSQSSQSQCEQDLKAEPHRVFDLWFNDGSLVLQAGSSLYRISRSILAARSAVFNDMFHLPLSSPERPGFGVKENVPLILLPDSATDVTHFLRAIFDSGYFEPTPRKSSFEAVRGVLRLSHKYDVPYLQTRALEHLTSAYPATLALWDSRVKETTFDTKWDLCEAFTVVQLAVEVDASWLLPAAVYRCCTYPINEILDLDMPSNRTNPTFSAALRLCLTTWPKIRDAYHILYGHLRTIMCTNWPRCLVFLNNNTMTYSSLAGAAEVRNDPLERLENGYWSRLERGLCEGCYKESRQFYDDWRSDLWLRLPGMLGLEGYEEIEKVHDL